MLATALPSAAVPEKLAANVIPTALLVSALSVGSTLPASLTVTCVPTVDRASAPNTLQTIPFL